jgi:hypothetical protein
MHIHIGVPVPTEHLLEFEFKFHSAPPFIFSSVGFRHPLAYALSA